MRTLLAARPRLAVVVFVVLALPVCASADAAQVTFEQTTVDLTSSDPGMRLRAVRMLREAAYPEAASPIATVLTDPEDVVQLEAIAAELNIFLAERVASRTRVAFIIEKRTPILAEAAFSAGPMALGPRPVPLDVLTALRAAARDDNPRVAVEALYAFGTLASEARPGDRRALLAASGPDLAAMIGVPDPARRFAALRVLGRLFERRPGDEPIEVNVGDAVIVALNEKTRAIRDVAMWALGSLRYERGIQALTDLFQHYGKGVEAETALEALARIAHPASAVLLTAQLDAGSSAMKAIAIGGLARMGDRAVLASIDGVLSKDRTDGVRLAGQFAAAQLSNAPVDALVDALNQPRAREQARQYLVELAQGHPDILVRQSQDPDPRVRADVVDVLGLTRSPAVLPLAEAMGKDADQQVARAAERAVARLRPTP